MATAATDGGLTLTEMDMDAHILQGIIGGIELGNGLPESLMTEAQVQRDNQRKLVKELQTDSLLGGYAKFKALLKRSMCIFSLEELKSIIGDGPAAVEQGTYASKPDSIQFDIVEILDQLMPGAFTEKDYHEVTNYFGDYSIQEFRGECFAILSEMDDQTQKKPSLWSREQPWRTKIRLWPVSPTEDLYSLAMDNSEYSKALSKFGNRGEQRIKHTDIPADCFENWTLLYCGGSQPVVDTLQKIANKTGLKFKTERFDW